jgi:hypothetical protein
LWDVNPGLRPLRSLTLGVLNADASRLVKAKTRMERLLAHFLVIDAASGQLRRR